MGYLNPAQGVAREHYSTAGAPGGGANEEQAITIAGVPTGGTFTLSFEGAVTDPIPWVNVNATLLSNVQTALRALGSIGTGGVDVVAGTSPTLTAGVGQMLVNFVGTVVRRRALPNIVVVTDAITPTAVTITVTEISAGVNPDNPHAPLGALLTREDTGELYVNTDASWVKL